MTFKAEIIPGVESAEARLRKYRIELEDIIQELLEHKKGFIGSGRVAEIHVSGTNPEVCYKIVTDPLTNKNYKNDVAKESKITDALHDTEIEGVRTPHVYFSYIGYDDETGEEVHAIAMERLQATSVRDIMDGAKLPDNFDLPRFISGLRSFIQHMHSATHIYHRDLHEGNVMIDWESGNARVIDFGDARESHSEEDDPYTDENTALRTITKYSDDLDKVTQIQISLQKVIDKDR